MAKRATFKKQITSPELIAKINPENQKLVNKYMKNFATKRSPNSVNAYKGNFNIFFVWNLLYNNNKLFTDFKKIEMQEFFDFALTEKGDILFKQNTSKSKPIKICFAITNGKAIKIKLRTEDCSPLIGSDNGIKISFNNGQNENNKKAIIFYDNDAKIQAIKIRLQTALGDTAGRQSLGSKLETVKHKQLYDKNVQQQVISMVKEAIQDIMPNADVRVKPVATKSDRGYTQKIVIYIYEYNILIFKYDLKG
jgi:phage baseplate assembly protein W